mgnify:CR=1 FL=1
MMAWLARRCIRKLRTQWIWTQLRVPDLTALAKSALTWSWHDKTRQVMSAQLPQFQPLFCTTLKRVKQWPTIARTLNRWQAMTLSLWITSFKEKIPKVATWVDSSTPWPQALYHTCPQNSAFLDWHPHFSTSLNWVVLTRECTTIYKMLSTCPRFLATIQVTHPLRHIRQANSQVESQEMSTFRPAQAADLITSVKVEAPPRIQHAMAACNLNTWAIITIELMSSKEIWRVPVSVFKRELKRWRLRYRISIET